MEVWSTKSVTELLPLWFWSTKREQLQKNTKPIELDKDILAILTILFSTLLWYCFSQITLNPVCYCSSISCHRIPAAISFRCWCILFWNLFSGWWRRFRAIEGYFLAGYGVLSQANRSSTEKLCVGYYTVFIYCVWYEEPTMSPTLWSGYVYLWELILVLAKDEFHHVAIAAEGGEITIFS